MTTGRRLEFRLACAVIGALALATNARAQELGGAGTVQGTVKDPTGAVMQAVDVRIGNAVSGYSRTATTDAAGKFVFRNLPPNPYHITVSAQGFRSVERDVDVRSGVPITIDLSLAVAACGLENDAQRQGESRGASTGPDVSLSAPDADRNHRLDTKAGRHGGRGVPMALGAIVRRRAPGDSSLGTDHQQSPVPEHGRRLACRTVTGRRVSLGASLVAQDRRDSPWNPGALTA